MKIGETLAEETTTQVWLQSQDEEEEVKASSLAVLSFPPCVLHAQIFSI
jgi:hypothetical protein